MRKAGLRRPAFFICVSDRGYVAGRAGDVLENSRVERFGKFAADHVVTAPADPRSEQVQAGNADAQWQIFPHLGKPRDSEPAGGKIVEARGFPGAGSLAHFAQQSDAYPFGPLGLVLGGWAGNEARIKRQGGSPSMETRLGPDDFTGSLLRRGKRIRIGEF